MEIKYEREYPKKVINQIIRSLSKNSAYHHLFVCDEVFACNEEGQKTANWTDLVTPENVTWILATRPDSSNGDEIKNLSPPLDSELIISRKLLYSHRNSYQIRSVGIFEFLSISYQ